MQVFSLYVPSWWQYTSLGDAGCSGIFCLIRGSVVYKIIRHSIITVVTSLQQVRYLTQRKDSQRRAYLWKCYLLPKCHVSMSRKAAGAAEDSCSCQFPSVPQEGNVALCKAGSQGWLPRALQPPSHPGRWKSFPRCAETLESSLCSKIQKYTLYYSQREGVGILNSVLCQSRGFQVSSP